jgi:flagellar biosynthesis GTPase FlhF
VKQGSLLVYLTFHIFTIFIILVSCILKKSVLSFGYILILLPKLTSGSNVLDQREMLKAQRKDKLETEMEEEIARKKSQAIEHQEQKERSGLNPEEHKARENRMRELEEKMKVSEALIEQMRKDVYKIKNSQQFKHFEESLNKGKAQEKWNMIGTFNRWLLFYALFDFSLQLLYQLPIFEPEADFANIGLNKIWSINHPSGRHHHKNPLAALTLKRFQESILDKDQYDPITGLQFQPTIFY